MKAASIIAVCKFSKLSRLLKWNRTVWQKFPDVSEKYRVSIKSFPDYKHLVQENWVEYKHIFLCNSRSFFLTCICLTARRSIKKKISVTLWRHCGSARYAITLTRAVYTHVWARKWEGGEIRKNQTYPTWAPAAFHSVRRGIQYACCVFV